MFDFSKLRSQFKKFPQFQHSDISLLEEILATLCINNTLKLLKGTEYQVTSLDLTWMIPRVFDESLKVVLVSYSEAIPNRLKGKYHKFTGRILDQL